MKHHLLLSVSLFAVLLLAACGGGGGSAAKFAIGDIAVVGSQHVTKTMYDDALAAEAASLKSQGQTMPKPGSTNYATLKSQILTVLVQRAEFAAQAEKLKIAITPAKVEARLTAIKKQYFGGSEKTYQAQLKKQGVWFGALGDLPKTLQA